MRKPVSVTTVREVAGSTVISLSAAFAELGWERGTLVKAVVVRTSDGVERILLERFK